MQRLLRSEISIKDSVLAPWPMHPISNNPNKAGVSGNLSIPTRHKQVLFLLQIYTALSGKQTQKAVQVYVPVFSKFTVYIHVFSINSIDHFETLYSILLDQVSDIFYKAGLIEGYLTVAQILWPLKSSLSMQNGQ